MSLRYVVPTLGLMAFTIAPAMAADVGGLNVGGYVDTVLGIADGDDALPGGEDAEVGFAAAAQLEVGYQIGDAVSANVELYYTDDASDIELEQAYASWAINEQVSLVMGKFHSWVGWEGFDTPELYRVNNSLMYGAGPLAGTLGGAGDLRGIENVTGLGAIIKASEQFELGVFIVDHIFAPSVTTDSVSFGAYATFTAEGLGYFDLDLAFGADEGGVVGDETSIFQIDFNGEIDTLRQDQGLLFAWDLNYTDRDEFASLGFLALANYALPTETPMSATLSLNWFDPVDDDDIVEDDEALEVAVALLANPTDNENFSVNTEFRYISRSADDANEFGLFVEALAVIP